MTQDRGFSYVVMYISMQSTGWSIFYATVEEAKAFASGWMRALVDTDGPAKAYIYKVGDCVESFELGKDFL